MSQKIFYSGATWDIAATAGIVIPITTGNLDAITYPGTSQALFGDNQLFYPSGAVMVGDNLMYPNGDTLADADGNLRCAQELKIASGANKLAGTVTLSAGVGTITSSLIDANTAIVLSLKTSSGTPGLLTPRTSVGTGSATVNGTVTDNSTYNWIGMKVA